MPNVTNAYISCILTNKQGDACKNFLSLLTEVDAPYYMFCDQDDIWHKDKIELSMSAICEDQPTIVHTDLRMVDQSGNMLNKSFWKHSHILPHAITEFRHYASTTVVTGCTMLFNKAAKECVRFNPKHARMHDAWVTLCVVINKGNIIAIDQQTIDYRQHGHNTLGVPDSSRFSLRYKISHLQQIINENCQQYLMLRELGYPGIFTYYIEKLRYHKLS